MGTWLNNILKKGGTEDWRRVLKEATGKDISTRAMTEYFKPLMSWLEQQNKGRQIGWEQTNGPRAGRLQHQRVADNAFHLRISADRVVRNSVLHLAGGFHDLSLHHRHYVCHVSTKLLHSRFSDWRAVKISKRLQLVRCEIFHHRVYHRFG